MTASKQATKIPIIFTAIAIYLILKVIWRLVIPGGSYPLPPWHIVAMATDILLAIVLTALWLNLPEPSQSSPSYAKRATPLFWGGITAVAIMILLRFTSVHSWWTGHLLNGN